MGELGITLLKAVKAVFNDVNAAGGIYGRKLQLVDCDTSFTSGDKPRACYTKLTQQDKIFAFAATGDGPAWVTAAPLACKDQIPALWTDGLSQNEFTCPTIFPTGPAGRSQARVVLDYYIKAKKPKTVGILAQNDDIGNEWLVGAKEVLAKYGVKVVSEEKYNLGETNFTTQVTNMRFANPDFVFFSSEPLGPILFQKTAEGQGWKPPMPSAGVTCNVSVWPKQVGDYSKGMICQNPWQLLSAKLPGQVEFEKNYKKYWSDWDKRNYYTETMWIAARATVETLRRAGPNLTRARVLEVLRSGAFNGFDTGFGVKFTQQSSAKGNLFSIAVAVVEVAKPNGRKPLHPVAGADPRPVLLGRLSRPRMHGALHPARRQRHHQRCRLRAAGRGLRPRLPGVPGAQLRPGRDGGDRRLRPLRRDEEQRRGRRPLRRRLRPRRGRRRRCSGC